MGLLLIELFSAALGTTHQQYFIFAFPAVLVCLYLIPKMLGRLMSLDKNSNVKGDNHVAVLLILLTVPSILGSSITSGVVLVVLFSIWSWIDEQKAKKKI